MIGSAADGFRLLDVRVVEDHEITDGRLGNTIRLKRALAACYWMPQPMAWAVQIVDLETGERVVRRATGSEGRLLEWWRIEYRMETPVTMLRAIGEVLGEVRA